MFAVSNRHLNSLIAQATSTAIALSGASVTYRAGQDYATVLAPYLPLIEQVGYEASTMQKYWTIGFSLWSAYLVALVVVSRPLLSPRSSPR